MAHAVVAAERDSLNLNPVRAAQPQTDKGITTRRFNVC